MKSLLIRNVRLGGRRVDILIEAGRVRKIGQGLARPEGARLLDGRGMTALPPLYNAHTHAAMTLLRGYADDMRLQDWLESKIWPIESKMTEEDVYVGARLACLEMIKSGTVFVNDMYWHWHGTAHAVEEMGLRGALSSVFIDAGDSERGRKQRAEAERLFEERSRYSDRVMFAVGPHAIYTVSDENLRWSAEFARRTGSTLHIHVSETAREVTDCIARHNRRPVEHLDALGVLGPNVFAAHCVHLSGREIELLAEKQVKVVHIPISNMKLAVGGIMHYEDLRKAGVTVLLGTDGCSSNNNLDMFQTMKFAALLQKHDLQDPTTLPAPMAWAMATSRAADAFGLDGVGLAPGARADLILVDLVRPECVPAHNLMSDLVYAANGYCVDTVICDGQVLMHRRKVRNEAEILTEARKAAARLARKVR